jgi:hypothetical protein
MLKRTVQPLKKAEGMSGKEVIFEFILSLEIQA